MQSDQERDTPAASGPCPKALRHLGGSFWLALPDEVHDLPLLDAKAVADEIIHFHGAKSITPDPRRGGKLKR